MPAFTKAGLFDYIIELIICEDEVSATHLHQVRLSCETLLRSGDAVVWRDLVDCPI
jgi:hypothetical protein